MNMMIQVKSGGLDCVCAPYTESSRIIYMIYPALVPFKHEWIREMSDKYKTPIAVVYIPADGWNDMLTPWAEPGETHDSPPFAGKGETTLKILQDQVIPEVEKSLGLENIEERNLIGVSLSGLFTLWQWIKCDTFKSIACLSGSFWYPDFLQWFEKQPIPVKTGSSYFLLGEKEPKAWIKAYRSVGVNTETIVKDLQSHGIPVTFQWVPGDHFADPTGRAEHALKFLS